MTKFKNISNKIFLCVLIILSFFLTQNAVFFSQFNFMGNGIVIHASNQGSDSETLYSNISNYNFASTTSGASAGQSNLPTNYTGNTNIKTPSNWTKDGTANRNMYIGVINIFPSSFNANYTNYNLGAKDSPYLESMSSDNNSNVLMINSDTENTFGYQSGSFTLDANSYYSITVSYYTGTKDSPTASICLIGEDFNTKSETAFLGMETSGNWARATFWVSTNQANSSSAQIGLYLGSPARQTGSLSAEKSSGYVFFDNIKLVKHSKTYFDSQDKTSNYPSYTMNSVVDLKYDNITAGDGFIADGDFTDSGSLNESWTIKGSSFIYKANAQTYQENNTVPAPLTNARSGDNNVLMVYNTANKNGKTSGSVTSKEFTVKQHTVYRISFWAKTNASSLIAKLSPVGKVNGNTYDEVSITSPSTSASKTTNDWKEYIFFVTGNSLGDATLTLTLGLSSSNNTSAEYIFFDNITSQKASSSDRDNASSLGITYTALNLNPTNTMTIANGYFNIAENIDRNVSYPLSVSGWTYGGVTHTANAHGIVNLDLNLFEANKKNFGDAQNPTTDNSSNNVLMINNGIATTQTYTSTSSISASANTAYKFDIKIYTDVRSSSGGVNIYIKNSSGVILAQFLDINTEGSWQDYAIFFKNYGNAQTLNVSISFGRENKTASGWAYFDNCLWDTYDETKSGSLSTITQTKTTKVANLTQTSEGASAYYSDTFGQYDNSGSAGKDPNALPYGALYWKGEVKATQTDENEMTKKLSDEDISAGVITKDNIDRTLLNKRVNSDINREFLMIHSTSDNYYAMTNKLSIPLSASSYYRVSVWVKTVGLAQETTNQQTIDDTVVPYGASIIIEGLDQSFTGINTGGTFGASDSGWMEYIHYINTTDAIDMALLLGLGSENGWTSGYAFFDDITVLSMSEDEYNLALNADSENQDKKDRIISIVNTTLPEDEKTPEGSATYSESLAWLSIPTVIIAVGVIIAIAGYSFRKYREKRPLKVKVTSNYDRSSTLLKDLDHRNYKASVLHRLKLLNEELAQTQEYLREEKIEHKKQMEAYETAKEITKQDSSIKLEAPNKKYMDFDRTVEQLENNIASIKTDIDLLEEEKRQITLEEQRVRKQDLKGNKITKRK